MVGYDGGRVAGGGPRRPGGGDALRAHPADPGGPGDGLARAPASWSSARRRDRAAPARPACGWRGRCRGSGSGRTCTALADDLGLAGFVLQRRGRRGGRGRGRPRRRSTASWSACGAEAPAAGRGSSASSRASSRRWATAASRSCRATRGGDASRRGRPPTPPPAPTACASCRDPADRRYRYPFINCTACGPRFTIVTGRPLRPRRAPRWPAFPMCDACRAEYEDPADRRFHAAADRLPGVRPAVALDGAGRPLAADPSPRRPLPAAGADRRRSRASAATTSRAGADDEAAVARLRGAQAARGEAVRGDGARPRGGRSGWSGLTGAERALLDGRRAADRARPAPPGRGGRAVGGAAAPPTSA